MNSRSRIGGIAILLAMLASSSALGEIIEDSVFDDADWMRTAILQQGPNVFTELAGQELAGGNPDEYREMEHTWGNGTQVVVFHKYLGETYDPSTQGAILEIDYSEDQIKFPGSLPGSIGRGLILMQDGVTYRTLIDFAFSNSTWQTFFLTALTADDFVDDVGGPGTNHPDFSASGNPIQFGYWRSNTIVNGFGTVLHGIDNFSVVILSVPEAEGIVLLMTGSVTLLLFGLLRHRKARLSRSEAGDAGSVQP